MPPVTKNIIIINALVYLATQVAAMRGIDLEQWLALHFFMASGFNPLQLVTYMFMHGSVMHILLNMFTVWMFGRILEETWGPRRFFIYYMVCGIGAGLIQEVAQYCQYLYEGLDAYQNVRTQYGIIPMAEALNNWRTVGASGSVYGLLLAFGLSFPDQPIFLYFLLPIKAKFFVVGYAVIELLEALSQRGDGVAHCAHLGGMLFGLLLILYWQGRLRLPSFSFELPRRRPKMAVHEGGAAGMTVDEQYNLRRQQRQEEIDRILKKVHDHGYGCLTEQEKRTLFNAGQ